MREKFSFQEDPQNRTIFVLIAILDYIFILVKNGGRVAGGRFFVLEIFESSLYELETLITIIKVEMSPSANDIIAALIV